MAWVSFYLANATAYIVIRYHTHFLLTITHVGGSNEVNMRPVQHWLPFVKTATPFTSQKILFKARTLGSNLLRPKGD